MYNVYIVNIATEKATAIIGRNMTESRAERREMTGLMRIDTDNWFVDTVPVGSPSDLSYLDDITPKN